MLHAELSVNYLEEWLTYHCQAGFFLEIILGSRSSLNLHKVGLALEVHG